MNELSIYAESGNYWRTYASSWQLEWSEISLCVVCAMLVTLGVLDYAVLPVGPRSLIAPFCQRCPSMLSNYSAMVSREYTSSLNDAL